MSMEENLHAVKFTKKEEPKSPVLKIVEMSLSYKIKLPDSKKAVHIMRCAYSRGKGLLLTREKIVHQ